MDGDAERFVVAEHVEVRRGTAGKLVKVTARRVPTPWKAEQADQVPGGHRWTAFACVAGRVHRNLTQPCASAIWSGVPGGGGGPVGASAYAFRSQQRGSDGGSERAALSAFRKSWSSRSQARNVPIVCAVLNPRLTRSKATLSVCPALTSAKKASFTSSSRSNQRPKRLTTLTRSPALRIVGRRRAARS